MSILIKKLSHTQIDQTYSPSKLLSQIINNRKIKDIDEFLKPPYPKFVDTDININIKKYKNILIYGDYDVDGITATAILWQTLTRIGLTVHPFIPERELDGYGFRHKSFQRIQSEKITKFDLLITVDNGIVAYPELLKVKKSGVDIIVIDHHEPDKTKKDLKKICQYLIHSPKVSGSALSWFVSHHLDKNADLGLAALGTVADCLPLIGINRSIVVHGLISLRLNPSPGIKKLLEISKIKPSDLSAYHLGFILGPRINAVGRLSNPTDALRLLCSSTPQQASKFASILDQQNRDRQILQTDHIELASQKIDLKNKILFVSDKTFHPGIIGLISGRLTEKYYLPSVAISLNGDIAKGSCRSVPELNIIKTLREFSDLFVDLGGHAAAAGFSIKSKNIPILKNKLIKYVNKKLSKITLLPTIEVDAPMKLSAVTVKNYSALQKLAPFGIGNPEPLFHFENLKINYKRAVGSTLDHLQIKLDDPTTKTRENTTCSAIAFKKGSMDKTLKIGDSVDIIASLSANTWNNITTPQLIVREIIEK